MFAKLRTWLAAHPATAKAITDIWTPVAAVAIAALAAFSVPADANLATVAGLTLTLKLFVAVVGIPVLNALINAARRSALDNGSAVFGELQPMVAAQIGNVYEVSQLLELLSKLEALDPDVAEAVKSWVRVEVLKLVIPKQTLAERTPSH